MAKSNTSVQRSSMVQEKSPLELALQTIQNSRFVDLTHAFEPGIPHWEGLPDEVRTFLYHHDQGVGTRGSGFLIHQYAFAGQWGTHADAPAHFVRGKRFLDEIDVREMILPLVIFDVASQVNDDPDFRISMSDIEKWESRFGPVPRNAFAVMKTNWSMRWPDASLLANRDEQGTAHYPGWSLPVLQYLFTERNVAAIGHETTDTDAGVSTSKGDYSLEHFVLAQDRYQIELIASLNGLPEAGGIAVVTFPKPKHGSGFPARVFAIVP